MITPIVNTLWIFWIIKLVVKFQASIFFIHLHTDRMQIGAEFIITHYIYVIIGIALFSVKNFSADHINIQILQWFCPVDKRDDPYSTQNPKVPFLLLNWPGKDTAPWALARGLYLLLRMRQLIQVY